MDSDSDNDMPANNVFTFGNNRNMTVCANVPKMINGANLSFQNRIPASTMHMPRNMQHSTYASSVYDQRSVHSRREVSPMSVRSAYDFQPRNFNMSHYPRGMSSQRSVMNGRSGSPMSITSTTSDIAVGIAKALKNVQFDKHDLKIISEAYKKLQKCKIRKKFEKRRNRRLFLKGARRKSGGESGDLGSDSSVSDDDCRSNRSSVFNGNVSSCRSIRTDLTTIRRTMQESNMYNDCSANFKQKSFKNMFSIDSGFLNPNLCNKTQNRPLPKDRFKSSFLLPSQRYNKSVSVTTIPENVEKQQRKKVQNSTKENFCVEDKRSKNVMSITDSEHDEIFAEVPDRQTQLDTEQQRKRILEKDEDTHMPHKKKNKLSPIKKISDDILNGNRDIDKNQDDFAFAKPSFPIKRVSNLKIKEKIIAKSPNINSILEKNNLQEKNDVPTIQHSLVQVHKENQCKEIFEATKHSDTDVSMRPSFIKRKLFTQKLDVAENKILSSDENSPKTVYGGIQKEKNKARKLVTNQSCLSRDVLQDDNYLDLIHKIVPPDQMNTTNQPNKNSIEMSSKDVDDKLESTSVIVTCNNDNVSDTYTDEDIFHDNNKIKNIINKDKKSIKIPTVPESRQDCKVILKRVPSLKIMQQENEIKNNPKQKVPSKLPNVNKSNVKVRVKSFWDTDTESDFEFNGTLKRSNCANEQQVKGNNFRAVDLHAKNAKQPKPSIAVADISLLNSTTATVHKFNNTTLSIRSHRVTKKRKCCEELDQPNSTLNRTQNNNPKSSLSCLSHTMFANNVKTNNVTKSVPENKTKNSRTIRSCRTPKQNSKDTIINEKINNNTDIRRSLRSSKVDLSNATLDGKTTPKRKSKKQNANNNKQSKNSNNKDTEKTKDVVNSRKSDVSFSLNIDIKAVKTKKVPYKNTDSANNRKEHRPRQSNVSFSILSESPLTRSKAANVSNEKQRGKRNNAKNNNHHCKDILEIKQVIKTPNKRNGKNGVINMVQNLKDNKSKSVRKR